MKSPKAKKLSSGVWRVQLRLGGRSHVIYGKTQRQAEQEALLYMERPPKDFAPLVVDFL